MAAIRVITPGLLTTVQDLGRWGWQDRGVPVAGPMDLKAHRQANLLAGNTQNEAGLEVTLTGPELEFGDARVVAVAGADFALTIGGRAQPGLRSFLVPAGGILRFGERRLGARAYLAIEGGIALRPVLGSRSTHLPSVMGGLDGRALRAGDELPLGPAAGRHRLIGRTQVDAPSGPRAVVRVLPGPQLDRFVPDALETLQSAEYVVDAASNRMGFRLDGPGLRHAEAVEMLSDATPFGAVQVPPGAPPILLMADRQTTGGYPNIATVITADLGIAGQLAPGDRVAFAVCSRQEALGALIAQEQALMALESALGA